ncbi:GNAT family N-acetyltransferase [Enterococcus cecorum]|nr:GNAT family N-acetyltransferase [Enterococcus cecorum]CAI3389659.1 GNAT family N-acetyltransferase [Enterococcus cecorum]CAI3398625.1 GNAT family N-acetyltransferase [Enterococcus cecorum]CAI3403495.1 GNAT family N-acetyltransferase [Enterococcus cecorum]
MAIAKKLPNVKAQIYSFNHQSQRMFTKLGFVQVSEEWFELKLQYEK